MIAEWELWTCAHHVLRQDGERAPAFVAERLETLADAGDAPGVQTWRAIGARIERLSEAPAGSH